MVTGVLSLKPRYPPPYVMPVIIMNCEAALSATAGGKTSFVAPTIRFTRCFLVVTSFFIAKSLYADCFIEHNVSV